MSLKDCFFCSGFGVLRALDANGFSRSIGTRLVLLWFSSLGYHSWLWLLFLPVSGWAAFDFDAIIFS